jgi:hypothetical protein
MVEAFFRDLTENRLKRGVFRSVLALIEALDEYVDHHNAEPKPFIWTAGAQDIVARVMRAQGTLNKRQNI